MGRTVADEVYGKPGRHKAQNSQCDQHIGWYGGCPLTVVQSRLLPLKVHHIQAAADGGGDGKEPAAVSWLG